MALTGATTILDVTGGTLGGAYAAQEFTLSTGTEGKFLTVSLAGTYDADHVSFQLSF